MDGEWAACEFADVADFIFESVIFNIVIGKQHAKAVFAETTLLHPGIQ